MKRLPTRTMRWTPNDDREALLTREWLVANGRGGYASGSIAGVPTRRFHGLLVAALPAPIGRAMMLNHLFEWVRTPNGASIPLGGYERHEGVLEVGAAPVLRDFRLEGGLPVWRFELEGMTLEKRLFLVHLQNTVEVMYRIVDGEGTLRLKLRPSVSFRPHEADVGGPDIAKYSLHAARGRYEIDGPPGYPSLRMRIAGERHAFTIDDHQVAGIAYRVERERGYDYVGSLFSPGYFRADLAPGKDVTLIASTEPWEAVCALAPHEAWEAEVVRRERLDAESRGQGSTSSLAQELVLAADQFLVDPSTRIEDAARAHASGDQIRTVIAGYHWFTDWGRDTMISLEGLTLDTGRTAEAGYILRTFGKYVRDGLIPNMFPEGTSSGLYHTADATLWYFHALDRYLQATNDRMTLEHLLPVLREIFAKHMQGTAFGIGVDPRDGLLRQGEEGYQLTWMDAKVGDWVVTPRRGKAVEINALFYNALQLLAGWLAEAEGEGAAREVLAAAARVRTSFNERFWNAKRGCLFDVVDGEQGDDAALRPNQIFAVSLPHPVLDPSRWRDVVDVCERELVTPVGLRSLARGERDYSPRYFGDRRARDAAYHQGTVWAWLIGPFVDAWLKVHPGREADASRFLEGFGPHLGEACVGSISEIFDAEPPFTPRGCIAQAWSVAEVLRCLVKLRSRDLSSAAR